MPTRLRLAAVATVLLAVSLVAAPSSASAQAKPGQVRVEISGPKGVPANVTVRRGKRYVVARGADSTTKSTRTTVTVKPGRAKILGQQFTFSGRIYRLDIKPRSALVRAGKLTKVRVRIKAVPGAKQLRATQVGQDFIELDWSAPKGTQVILRRKQGDRAPSNRRAGKRVRFKQAAARDSGLTAGTTYSYALFSKKGRGPWSPGLTVTVRTGSSDPTAATYAAPPSTVIVEPTDADVVTPGGGVVVVALAKGRPTPVLGAGFVLPVSAVLPSGFLGKVAGISEDGRSVTLVGGGLADAFDYYDLNVDLGALPPIALRAGKAAARRSSVTGSVGGPKCLGITGSGGLDLNPVIKPGGHFKSSFVKKWGVPIAATFDLSAQLEVGLTADIDLSADLTCSISYGPIVKNLSVTPVPIAFVFEPSAQVSIGGALSVKNLGYTATGGFWTKGRLGWGPSVDAGLIKAAGPTPATGSFDVPLGFELGGEVSIGPGGGIKDAGVVVGVGGKFSPIKATFGPHFPIEDTRRSACIRTTAELTAELNVNAKAWLGDWSASASYSPPALQGSHSYGGPWYLPSDCHNLPEPDPAKPSTSLLGSGVVEVDTQTTGDASQWGHVDGFAPGSKAWVLSTGNIADAAVDDPSILASTGLGGDGDSRLSALVDGEATHDAASYRVTVKPTKKTLHVRYIFASEEYPEYVGKGFDDVMAVYVNGKNCALVPGTSERVSVDSINGKTNSQYYVDNQGDSAGYSTTMDGLTVPLECTVPVTPGEPVSVEIAIADTGDSIFDSVVGLVDKGIWSD